jgi:hemerythrin
MKKICWKNDYSVGVEKLDNQHRWLFEIINRVAAHREAETAEDTLAEMVRYAKEHFTDEEKLMRQYGYPGFATHEKHHAYFIDTTAELSLGMLNNKQATLDEIAEFLNVWLTTHVLREDMKYKDFFKAKIPAPADRQAVSQK